MPMNSWQRARTGAHLFLAGVRRRITLGARVALFDGEGDAFLEAREEEREQQSVIAKQTPPAGSGGRSGDRRLRIRAGIHDA